MNEFIFQVQINASYQGRTCSYKCITLVTDTSKNKYETNLHEHKMNNYIQGVYIQELVNRKSIDWSRSIRDIHGGL